MFALLRQADVCFPGFLPWTTPDPAAVSATSLQQLESPVQEKSSTCLFQWSLLGTSISTIAGDDGEHSSLFGTCDYLLDLMCSCCQDVFGCFCWIVWKIRMYIVGWTRFCSTDQFSLFSLRYMWDSDGFETSPDAQISPQGPEEVTLLGQPRPRGS